MLADHSLELLDRLQASVAGGDLRVHDSSRWDPASWPKSAQGVGFHEAPRGGLSHWVVIRDGKIDRYQAVVPSTWNGSPRDSAGRHGPYEASLLHTPIADAEQPLEVLRTIHSFDPCMACACHTFDPAGRQLAQVKVL